MDVIAHLDPLPDAGLLEVARLARRYCTLIESSERDVAHWLPEVADVLARLRMLMTGLPVVMQGLVPATSPDLDARFELFSHLHGLLADRDGYWLEFDLASDGQSAMSGSLADDLTDIYCELHQGLNTFEQDPQRALATWSLGYARHWAQHLADAERHLAALAVEGRL